MSTLKDQQWDDIYTVIDLLASEYGWSIEYIQNLTISEVLGLIHCILRRKGIKSSQKTEVVPSKDPMTDLIALAQTLKASPDQINNLKEGKGITL